MNTKAWSNEVRLYTFHGTKIYTVQSDARDFRHLVTSDKNVESQSISVKYNKT